MTPEQYCQQRAAASGSSFYYCVMFLAPPQRWAITALYACCREVDDVVDEATDERVARLKLDWWRTQVAIACGEPPPGEQPSLHPVTRALAPAIERHALPRVHLDEIIAGMQMDLDCNRYRSFDELRLYCHRVAGAVGLLSARIFGYREPATLEYADLLGIALQLTNIVRDVAEDARRNRIYLPTEDLDRFGVREDDLLCRRDGPEVRALVQFQIDRAQQHYELALRRLPEVDRHSQRTGLIMAAIYRTLLREIAAGGARVLVERTSLTPLRKLWIACRTAWTARVP
ncbi:MAG: presqualene diphosphate synthase HpnD [Pseudomonadota bacterium]